MENWICTWHRVSSWSMWYTEHYWEMWWFVDHLFKILHNVISDFPAINSPGLKPFRIHRYFLPPIQTGTDKVSPRNKALCYHRCSLSKLCAEIPQWWKSNSGLDDKVKGFECFHIGTVDSKADHCMIVQGRGARIALHVCGVHSFKMYLNGHCWWEQLRQFRRAANIRGKIFALPTSLSSLYLSLPLAIF